MESLQDVPPPPPPPRMVEDNPLVEVVNWEALSEFKDAKKEDWTVRAIGDRIKNRMKRYVMAHHGSKSLGRCLLDTGSEVNIIPKSIADKISLPRSRSSIPSLEGFDGSIAKVDGVWYGEVHPRGELPTIRTSFLIMDKATCPIIGIQMMQLMGLDWKLGPNIVKLPKGKGKLVNVYLESEKNA